MASLEVGYMLGLHKQVCFLKDKTLRTLPADLLGKLYREFDPQNPERSIAAVLPDWLSDMKIVRERSRSRWSLGAAG